MLALNNLHLTVLAAESSQRSYLLTRDENFLIPFTETLDNVELHLAAVDALIPNTQDQRILLDRLVYVVKDKLLELRETVHLSLTDNQQTALKIVNSDKGKQLYNEMKSLFEQIGQNEIKQRMRLYGKLRVTKEKSTVAFFISAVTSGLLLLGMILMARLNLLNQDRYRTNLEQQNALLTEKVQERTQELTLYSDELARSNRELEDFAFVASHDLQEPLRKIRAFGDRLLSNYADSLDERGRDYLTRMKNAAERMSNLISDLLEFSRITTRGKEFVAVNLGQVIQTVLNDLEIAIEESQTKVILPELPVITGDASQISQLFLNLFSNAIKFRSNQIQPEIELNYQLKTLVNEQTNEPEQFHVLTVSDNGIGFEQEFADKIFVPFQRLHGRTEYQGTGIGLAVCRRIVERHGGKISATSSLGQGAKFEIMLPVNAALNKLT